MRLCACVDAVVDVWMCGSVGGPAAIYAAKLLALVAHESSAFHHAAPLSQHLGKVASAPRPLPALVHAVPQDPATLDALLQGAATVLREHGVR